MKEVYVKHAFSNAAKHVEFRERLIGLTDEFYDDRLTVTVRQVYYQMVARNWVENSDSGYNKVQGQLKKLREAGLVHVDLFEDRGRSLERNAHWASPNEILESAAKSYREDLWENQEFRPIVLIEKKALVGLLAEVCATLDVTYGAGAGFSSMSFLRETAEMAMDWVDEGQQPVLLFLSDHDPSGIWMREDVRTRLARYSHGLWSEVEDIGLTLEQIEERQLPPNPSKAEDNTHFPRYRELVGSDVASHSWELDAIPPRELQEIVRVAILSYRDEDRWDEAVRQQEQNREQLKALVKS